MAFLMRLKPSKNDPRHVSGSCKKHTNHRPTPGVCSICLSQKLSKLAAGSSSSFTCKSFVKLETSSTNSYASSVSSYISSASSCLSPSDHCFDVAKFEFRKSKSMAVAGKTKKSKEKSTQGFFARLTGRSKRRRVEESLERSRSVRMGD